MKILELISQLEIQYAAHGNLDVLDAEGYMLTETVACVAEEYFEDVSEWNIEPGGRVVVIESFK